MRGAIIKSSTLMSLPTLAICFFGILVGWGVGVIAASGSDSDSRSNTARQTDVNSDDMPFDSGPDVVILDELEDQYDPVPFEHLLHAQMAEMWHGCVTCHHYSPHPGTSLSDDATSMTVNVIKTQKDSIEIPACKSCHSLDSTDTNINMPGLKGAYHRQCLGCHQEWMHENACVICHEPKHAEDIGSAVHSPDDIVGRMHPPIPEPEDVYYKMRFTPADGGNVLFRHQEHTINFEARCVDCHHQDNCAHCHGSSGDTSAQKPLQTGMTWDESHAPCMNCHRQDRCQHCHYKNDQSPPLPFEHKRVTGQDLDKDHVGLSCGECHADLTLEAPPTCGDANCHPGEPIIFPDRLPGLKAPPPLPAPVMSREDTPATSTLMTGEGADD